MTYSPEQLRWAFADRYTLEHELGRGGMATVWLARDPKHDRPVALKVLRSELAAALGPERFLREVQITAGLHHPRILPLLDSGHVVLPCLAESEGAIAREALYFVLPHVEGESLRNRLVRDKGLVLDEALQIAREVADALDYAHCHGVVHRDIKPENIMLEGGHAVVADFGIARAIRAAACDRLTPAGIAVGTPAYMSPEQAVGTGEIDGRSDIYSLGCVLYEMLTGRPPFQGSTVQAVLAKHAMDPIPSLRTERATIPASIEAVVERALAKDPADRFSTAQRFVRALG